MPPWKGEAAAQPRVDLHVDAVPVVRGRPVIGGPRDEVVRLSERGGRDVVEVADHIASRARQARIDRNRDAVRLVVGGRHRAVVGRRERGGERGRRGNRIGVQERIEIPPVIPGFNRQPGNDLALHRYAELPVGRPHAPPFQHRRIVGGGWRGQASEVLVGRGTALAVGEGIEEIAVRDIVAIGVRPRARGLRRHAAAESRPGGVGLDEDAGPLGRIPVLAGVDLQRRLAVTGQVDRGAAAERDVVVALHDVLRREHDRRGHEARRPNHLLGRAAHGVVIPNAAFQGDATNRPAILREDPHVLHASLLSEIVQQHRQLIRHAVAEPVLQPVAALIVARGDVVIGFEADLEVLRAGDVRERRAVAWRERAHLIPEHGSIRQVWNRTRLFDRADDGAVEPVAGVAVAGVDGAEAGFKEDLAGQRRRVRRLIRMDPVDVLRSVLRLGRCGRAPASPAVAAHVLFVPEQVELLARADLPRGPQRRAVPDAVADRLLAEVRIVREGIRVAGVLVDVHARHVALRALITAGQEEPELVLHDRSADGARWSPTASSACPAHAIPPRSARRRSCCPASSRWRQRRTPSR